MFLLPFLVAVVFFLVINLFLALFVSVLVQLLLKIQRFPVESPETSFLIFVCCASVWIGIRVILMNFYPFDNMAQVFLWPTTAFLPNDIIVFLNESTGL